MKPRLFIEILILLKNTQSIKKIFVIQVHQCYVIITITNKYNMSDIIIYKKRFIVVTS